jgi:5-formyltetrahydrofolate cyclo-ligase
LQSANPTKAVEKAAWRREMRALLRSLPPSERAEKSGAICRAMVACPPYQKASVVALFAAMATEPDLSALINDVAKTFAFPRIEGEEVAFYAPWPAGRWSLGWRGVREPDPGHSVAIPVEEIDLILVPGLAFTPHGHRLGRGGGYYDRLLARLPAGVPRIGVAFAAQVVERLPIEPHDATIDSLLCENGWSAAGSSNSGG